MSGRGFGLLLIFCALVIAGAGWRYLSAEAAAPVAMEDAGPVVTGDRVYLTRAQQREAAATAPDIGPVRSILHVRGPMHYGDYQWNEAHVPAGPVAVRVDLSKQLLSVFRAGHEIGTSVIVYGTDGKQTPTGTFPILARMKDHESAQYDAEMPYTLRLTNDGVSLHASSVEYGHATHGCVGVPLEFAHRLFDATRVGDKVTILAA